MADKIFSVADGLHDKLPSVKKAEAGRMLITTDRGEMYYEPEDEERIQINPQADWQQNDETANDYIKNRPGGYEALTEILPETTLNFTSRQLTLTDCPPIEVGKTYTVTFYRPNTDPIEYELVGKEASIGSAYRYIGNEAHTWGGTNTGEPFIIYSYDNNTAIVTYIYISSSETLPCTYNIKIKAIAPIKIDEKYLDIKNTNIVNGSAAGSLRTIGSKEENSSYTIGIYAFAEGSGTKASGVNSHAEGSYTEASGVNSHAEGYGTIAKGSHSHAEGHSTIAKGSHSHAEGHSTTAKGSHSHAEGYNTTALNSYSHSEGNGTTAKGISSHAEGSNTIALGSNSHTEGFNTTASGEGSHVEGLWAIASGDYSHTEGYYTTASSDYQHVQGMFNIDDKNNIYADIVGNGDEITGESNAYTLDWNGNGWFSGDVYVGSTSGTNKDEGSRKLATEEYIDTQIGDINTALDSIIEIQNSLIGGN